jgi:hypothetical protein
MLDICPNNKFIAKKKNTLTLPGVEIWKVFCEFDVDEVPIAIILFATGGCSVFINNLNGAVAKHSPYRLGDIA